MADYGAYISEGVDHLNPLAPLLAFPAMLSLLNLGEIYAVLDFRGQHSGIAFPFPTPIGDLWTFTSTPPAAGTQLPATEGTGSLLPPSTFVSFFVGAVFYAVLHAIFVAGYLGSIRQYRTTGTYDVITNVRRYTIRYLLLTLVFYGIVLLVFPLLVLSPVFALLVLPIILLVGYLFWGAWFLVCVRDTNTRNALLGSVHLATSESNYVGWSIAHLVLSAIFSILATWFVVNGGLVGILLGIVGVIPVGFVLTVASLSVIEDIVPPQFTDHDSSSGYSVNGQQYDG